MESNWRWNVWQTGWSGGPYKLIARLLDFLPGTWYLAGEQLPNGYKLYVGVADEQGSVNAWDFIQLVRGWGFPFDYPVEPD